MWKKGRCSGLFLGGVLFGLIRGVFSRTNTDNDISLARYDVMLRIMMLLPRVAMMRCLPINISEATSSGEAVIIGVANIIF